MQRRTFNKILGNKVLGLSALFLLSACGAQKTGNTNNGSGSGKLVFWTMQLKPQFDAYMKDLIAAFEKANPETKVEWVDIPWAEMESKILSAVAAKTAPDVVNLNPQFAAKLAEKKALLDLNSLVNEKERSAYFPNIWQANQLANATFGLPWYVATDVTIFNRDLFEKAGLNPNQVPKNYEQLAQAAAQIRSKTNKYAFLLTMDGGQVLESMVQMGMKLTDSAGKAAFNDEAGKAAFSYWVKLFQQQLIPRETLTEGHRKAIELYQAGELAMLLTGPQFLQTVAQNAPDIAKVSDVAPQIVGSTGKKSAAVMNITIPSITKNQSAAVKFALFLTNGVNQLEFCKVGNLLPSTIESAQDSYFTKSAPEATPMERARVVSASQLNDAAVLIPPAKDVDKLRKIIYEELQLAMLGDKPTDKALANAAERWNSL